MLWRNRTTRITHLITAAGDDQIVNIPSAGCGICIICTAGITRSILLFIRITIALVITCPPINRLRSLPLRLNSSHLVTIRTFPPTPAGIGISIDSHRGCHHINSIGWCCYTLLPPGQGHVGQEIPTFTLNIAAQ
jgi:hypothetical protein